MVKRKDRSWPLPPTLTVLFTLLFALGLLVVGGCGGDETAGDGPGWAGFPRVIDEAAVAAMDLSEFRATMTSSADHLIAHLGADETAFPAVLFAVDRGYDAYQLLTGALNEQVQADGRILSAEGTVLTPARVTERIITLPGSAAAPVPHRPVQLASLSGAVLVAETTDYDDGQVALGDAGVFRINDILGVMKQSFDDAAARAEADVEFERRYTTITMILAARGYDAAQIAEALLLEQVKLYVYDPNDITTMCWYIEHPSGVVLRPANQPLDPFLEMMCPAPDKEAPMEFDPEWIKEAAAKKGLVNVAAATVPGEKPEQGVPGGQPVEVYNGTYKGELTNLQPAPHIIEWIGSSAVVEILDGVVTGTVEHELLVRTYRGKNNEISVVEYCYQVMTFTGTLNEYGKIGAEGVSKVEYTVVSFEPEDSPGGVGPTQSAHPEGYPITMTGTVGGGHLEGELLWDGETRYTFECDL